MKLKFDGEVGADILEIRFPFSGKVVFVGKKTGDEVKEGEVVASLDRTLLQKELDKELADYGRIRAQFDEFTKKNGPNPISQAQLDVSVKQVEIAKYHLDQVALVSPVNGFILDDNGLTVGLNVTPAGNGVKIVSGENLFFEFTVFQDKLKYINSGQKGKVIIDKAEFEVEIQRPLMGKEGKFNVRAKFDKASGLLPGLRGKVLIK